MQNLSQKLLNFGALMKVLAKILFALLLVGGIVVVVLFALTEDKAPNPITLIIIVVASAISYISLLCNSYILIALGQIVLNTEGEKQNNRQHNNLKAEKKEKEKIFVNSFCETQCPNCGETLSFTKEEMQKETLHCPWCDKDFTNNETEN